MVFNMVGGAGGGIKLESIAITTPPDNITYLPGEVFDPAGMVVTASYSNGETLTATGWTYSPSGALPEGTSEVEIIYTEAGVTKTAVQAITVERGTISVPTVSGSLTSPEPHPDGLRCRQDDPFRRHVRHERWELYGGGHAHSAVQVVGREHGGEGYPVVYC